MRAEPLYRRVLGARYDEMPAPLRHMHDVRDRRAARGRASVERGKGVAARLIAWAFRFPRAGADVPVEVTLTARRGGEVWERRFAGRKMVSIQEAGRGAMDGLLIERFGPFAFSMTVTVVDGRLRLDLRDGWLIGIPLPRLIHPHITAFEHDADGRFNFHVDLGLPLVGRIVRYIGWLEQADAA